MPSAGHNDSQTISLPYGWEKKCIRRPDGKNKGRWDIYLRPPNGNQLRSQAQLLKYLKKYPDVPHDATSSDIPADKEIIARLPNLTKSAAPKSSPQPPRSPRGRNLGRRLSQAAFQNNYGETQQ